MDTITITSDVTTNNYNIVDIYICSLQNYNITNQISFFITTFISPVFFFDISDKYSFRQNPILLKTKPKIVNYIKQNYRKTSYYLD